MANVFEIEFCCLGNQGDNHRDSHVMATRPLRNMLKTRALF